MGIKGLQLFMTKHFLDKLEYEPLTGPLVIDGCGIMYDLYLECVLDWRVGGRYAVFKKKVTEFFKTFVNSGVSPVVVTDGLDLDGMKFDTKCKRKRESIKAIKESIKARKRSISKLIGPHFLLEVFLEAVRETRCELIFADGEADPVVMQIANERQCPVLANDSDFFIFPLAKGFVLHSNDLFRKSIHYKTKVFRQDDFVRQWLAPGCGELPINNDLCLLIPALVGNDFLKPTGITTCTINCIIVVIQTELTLKYIPL